MKSIQTLIYFVKSIHNQMCPTKQFGQKQYVQDDCIVCHQAYEIMVKESLPFMGGLAPTLESTIELLDSMGNMHSNFEERTLAGFYYLI